MEQISALQYMWQTHEYLFQILHNNVTTLQRNVHLFPHFDLTLHPPKAVSVCLRTRTGAVFDTHLCLLSFTSSYLVNERSKAVVEGLDLLLLLGADSLDGGVDLEVQGGQQAPVHSHSGDGGLRNHAATHAHTHAHSHASSTHA